MQLAEDRSRDWVTSAQHCPLEMHDQIEFTVNHPNIEMVIIRHVNVSLNLIHNTLNNSN